MSGPFGLEMGLSATEINAEQVAPGAYKLMNVPQPHSAFESYLAKIAPNAGLFWIKAIGKNIISSSHGFELRNAFLDMKNKLTQSYGNCESIDLLLPGSIWNEPTDYMMSLIKQERKLGAIWESAYGSKLKNNVKSVVLIATAIDNSTGYLQIEYCFDNEVIGQIELSVKEDSAL